MQKDRRRKFGEFHCTCGNNWKSAYAFAEVWQKCKICDMETYPTNLRPLQYSGNEAGQKPHESDLCGMCQKLGRNCKGR